MVIKRIKPVSCAKVAGILYAMLGFLVGCGISVVALAGGFASNAPAGAIAPGLIRTIGAAAVIVIPIVYGCLGFVMALITALLYNLAAATVGGIEFETQ